jgi:hypothetical protein
MKRNTTKRSRVSYHTFDNNKKTQTQPPQKRPFFVSTKIAQLPSSHQIMRVTKKKKIEMQVVIVIKSNHTIATRPSLILCRRLSSSAISSSDNRICGGTCQLSGEM